MALNLIQMEAAIKKVDWERALKRDEEDEAIAREQTEVEQGIRAKVKRGLIKEDFEWTLTQLYSASHRRMIKFQIDRILDKIFADYTITETPTIYTGWLVKKLFREFAHQFLRKKTYENRLGRALVRLREKDSIIAQQELVRQQNEEIIKMLKELKIKEYKWPVTEVEMSDDASLHKELKRVMKGLEKDNPRIVSEDHGHSSDEYDYDNYYSSTDDE